MLATGIREYAERKLMLDCLSEPLYQQGSNPTGPKSINKL
jgi:hypothetical protein